jgi:Putative peptidoglycan binding domain
MRNRVALFTITIGFSLAVAVCADDNVREVQTKLSEEGFYSGEIDGAYSSDLSAALSRYQIRKGLPITGQLDADTSEALGAKPAVGPSTAGTEESSSETWRQLRRGQQRTSAKARRSESASTETQETKSQTDAGPPTTSTEKPPRSAPAAGAAISSRDAEPASAPPATAQTSSEITEPASAPPATAQTSSEITEPASAPLATTSADEVSTERVRDYVAAFVLAGLDKNVGAETEFFADRVDYYDSGALDREKIREDLKRYDERWPERHFWVAGQINIEPQSDNRVRVTFPLGFKLRNANRQSSGKVDKTLVLERAGDDLQIVAVREVKESKK